VVAVQHWRAVRMVERLPCAFVAGMPLVDDKCRGPWSEACDPVVQCAELLGDSAAAECVGLQVLAEPRGRAP
jgi:hypothetical protein